MLVVVILVVVVLVLVKIISYLVLDGDGIILLGLLISLGGVNCLLLLSTSTKCIDGRNVNDGDGSTSNFFNSLKIPTSLLSDVVICQPPWALGASSGKHGVLDINNDYDDDNNINANSEWPYW